MAEQISEYKGVRFHNLVTSPVKVTVTVAYGDKRLTFHDVVFAIDRTTGSYAYGEEMQLHFFSNKGPEFSGRAENNGYTRIEVEIPISLGQQVFEKALKGLWTYEVEQEGNGEPV